MNSQSIHQSLKTVKLMNDIGETMQAYCESIWWKTGFKQVFISSMHGKGIIVLTSLLQ